ncbi:hypothetical protein GUJ93_ZPchr0008g14119 [Zizania palustris]|uniref:RING-type E3 ubiquitin transferase n=1 Tax=Zizania palustris TaxID=103762 RepID=A0A8J5VJ56_ZIZPA|nr:hypothetical protein GUJ93_ZPchr0008g14119 [Zizania palustris]
MENADSRGKKARVESPVASVRVKQEAAEETHGGGGAVTSTATAAREVAVKIDAAVLHCPLCLLPLKPPIFQCGAGHLACAGCHGKLTDIQCQACGDGAGDGAGAGVYIHNPALDAFARSAKIRCAYHKYGCKSYVTYCEAADHERACPHARCSCPEPGCDFAGLPPVLLGHLTGEHSWPTQEISYHTVHVLRVSPLERRRLLVVQGDDDDECRVFLLAVGAHGATTTASVSCVRANATAGPHYTCKMWTQGPPDPDTGFKDTVMMETNVRSCSVPREVAMEEGTLLSVPRWLHRGASVEILLRVRIDKLVVANRSANASHSKN